MAKEGLSFEERRARARERAGKLQAAAEAGGDDLAWFDLLYDAAGDDVAQVPWADLEPHPGLAEWIGRSGMLHEGRAIDIACGLGDNAEALSDAGYDVTAFDLAQKAIDWAKQRFPKTCVDYRQANLFDLPLEWQGAFDLVHECYTIQALKHDFRRLSFGAVANLVAPGGKLLLICRSRGDDQEVEGPPWPISRAELAVMADFGLTERTVEEFTVDKGDRKIPHIRILYSRD